MNRKALLTSPTTYFWMTVVFYAAFEALNSTVVCRAVETIALTGLFSFLGFCSLVATVILMFRTKPTDGQHRWLRFAIPILIIVLFAFDFYLARGCNF